jgi:hypothetical protein
MAWRHRLRALGGGLFAAALFDVALGSRARPRILPLPDVARRIKAKTSRFLYLLPLFADL